MQKHYLDIDYKNTCFYEYSSTEKEGFEKYESTNGNVSYIKLYKKGVFGLLQSVSIVEDKQGRKKLIIRLLDDQDIYLASLIIYDQKGQIDYKLVEPLICLLPNLQKEQAYRLFPYSLTKEINKKERTFYGVSIKLANLDDKTVTDAVEPAYKRRKKDEKANDTHLPDLVFEDELGTMKPTAISIDAKKKFLIKILTESLETLGYNPDSNTNTAQEEATKEEVKPQTEQKAATPTGAKKKEEVATITADLDLEDEDYDDLPF